MKILNHQKPLEYALINAINGIPEKKKDERLDKRGEKYNLEQLRLLNKKKQNGHGSLS